MEVSLGYRQAKCKSSLDSVTGGSHRRHRPQQRFLRLSLLLRFLPSPFPFCSLPSILHFLPSPLDLCQSGVPPSPLLSLIPPPSSPPLSQAPGLWENPEQILGPNTTCAGAEAAPARLVVLRFQAAQSRYLQGLGSCLGPLLCVSAGLDRRVRVPDRRAGLEV